jgi:autonomous glycyl radical cofactor GrcA
MTNTTNSLVDTYIAAFNEADPQRRRDLVARSFTEDGTSTSGPLRPTGA